MTAAASVVVALALALAVPATGQASWIDLARTMAAPWPGIQRPDGALPDYLDAVSDAYGGWGETRYGDATMGYALLQTGLRDGDARSTEAGLRAVNYATTRVWELPSVFEQMAVAAAYNLTRGRPELEGSRVQWAAWLQRRRTVRLQYEYHFGNHWLVDAVSVLELRQSGLRAAARGTVPGGGPPTRRRGGVRLISRSARRRAIRLVNVRVPRIVRAGRPFVLSDRPDNPIAYHGLSVGLYARAVRLLGRRAAPAARRVVRQTAQTAALISAPNGDSGYFGRSQGHAWALSGTAYGAELAASLRSGSPRERERAHGVAQRALARLQSEYPVGPAGQLITPALAEDLAAGARGLDVYAGAPDMAGLALMLLNWTLELAPDEQAAGSLPADRRLQATISQEEGRFAVVRRRRTWFAVKMTRSERGLQAPDLRYDAGLALALTRVGGEWRELVPQRPRNGARSPTTAGPMLLGKGRGRFHGDSIRVQPSGQVVVRGEFRRGRGRRPRSATIVHRPLRCGVALTFAARRGTYYRLSAFFSRPPQITPTGASDGSQLVVASASLSSMRLAPGTLASGERARLWRVDIRLHARTARRVGLRFTAVDCA